MKSVAALVVPGMWKQMIFCRDVAQRMRSAVAIGEFLSYAKPIPVRLGRRNVSRRRCR